MSATPPSVQLLDPVVANQIAAGEVVTRPASVVKELVENSIDAGARRLEVNIEAGGTKRIVVVDDGHGMSRDDALLAVRRHATSKIRTAADLQSIGTLGFRGEALPSIASVSRLVLRTRRATEEHGTELCIDGGNAAEPAPVGCAPGTTVHVADIFYNVPARRKFLRAVATESAHVTEVLLAAALATPALSVTLERDGRRVREWLGTSDRADRVAQVLRTDLWAHCAGVRGPVAVEAYLAGPERARSGAAGLHLFVNARPVTDRSLARAVAAAFGPTLDRGRYPLGAVYVAVAPGLVDVNVHPQKAEVRFAHARAVTDAVFSIVRAELEARLGAAVRGPSSHEPARHLHPGTVGPGTAEGDGNESWAWPARPSSLLDAAAAKDGWGLSAGDDSSLPRAVEPTTPPSSGRISGPAERRPRFLAQARGRLLLYEAADELLVLDRPAAGRLLALHSMRRQRRAGSVAAQRLLFPVVQPLPSASRRLLDLTDERLGELGLDVRSAGPDAVALHAVPEPLSDAPAQKLLDELVHQAVGWTGELSDLGERRLRVALARHAAPAGAGTSEPLDALELLERLQRLPADARNDRELPWPIRRMSWSSLTCDGAPR